MRNVQDCSDVCQLFSISKQDNNRRFPLLANFKSSFAQRIRDSARDLWALECGMQIRIRKFSVEFLLMNLDNQQRR